MLKNVLPEQWAKVRGYIKAQPNKSMDVRAKQRLSYRDVLFPSRCVVAVSPHVISSVRQPRGYNNGNKFRH